MTAELFVVRIRSRGGQWTSLGLAVDDARALWLSLREQVDRIGAGPQFVCFTGRDDREVAVRARDISAVELAPEDEDRPGRRATGAGRPAPAAGDWLRSQAGAR